MNGTAWVKARDWTVSLRAYIVENATTISATARMLTETIVSISVKPWRLRGRTASTPCTIPKQMSKFRAAPLEFVNSLFQLSILEFVRDGRGPTDPQFPSHCEATCTPSLAG